MKHIVFIIAYLYFLYNDFKKREIKNTAISIYAIISLLTLFICSREIEMYKFIDISLSVCFGLVIYLLSYFSQEGLGVGDAMYFVINGFLLSLKENLILFLSGMIIAFIVSIVFIVTKRKINNNSFPFLPCLLPAILGYIVCTV